MSIIGKKLGNAKKNNGQILEHYRHKPIYTTYKILHSIYASRPAVCHRGVILQSGINMCLQLFPKQVIPWADS